MSQNPPSGNSPPRGPIGQENQGANAQLPVQQQPNAAFAGASAMAQPNAPAANAQAPPKAGCCAKKAPVETNNNNETKQLYKFTSEKRIIQEKSHIEKPEVGGAFMGMYPIDLTALKTKKLGKHGNENDAKSQHFLSGKEQMSKMAADGIYVDDPEVKAKYTDVNVQKLEERLLKQMPDLDARAVPVTHEDKSEFWSRPEVVAKYGLEHIPSFFKKTGTLELDNDLLADEMTRPIDIAFDKTMAYQTKETNAMLQDRDNAYKKNQFRLDITVGKIRLVNCKNIFCEDDKLCLEMKEQFKDYETRVSLAMIPLYDERLNHIKKEIDHKVRSSAKPEDIRFLRKLVIQVEKSKKEERIQIQKLADDLVKTWTAIRTLRHEKQEDKRYSDVKELQIFKDNINGIDEYNFNIVSDRPDGHGEGGAGIPSAEISRRNSAQSVKMYVNLLVNGNKIATSRKAAMTWPNYEVKIFDQFQIQTYTMPHSIQMELVMCGILSDDVIDKIEIEIPGTHVEALTCAAQLVQELDFSKKEHEDKIEIAAIKANNGGIVPIKKKLEAPIGATVEQRAAVDQKNKDAAAKELEHTKAREHVDVKGTFYVKAEWKGEGPKMPPIRHEDLFSKPKAPKNRFPESIAMLYNKGLIDVNDPRWDDYIQMVKEHGNSYLKVLFAEDAKNNLQDVMPFRHKLLIARRDNPEWANMFIPMLEGELIDGNRTTCYLEKLETLYRKEAYDKWMDENAAKQKEEVKNNDQIESSAQLIDYPTMRRRQQIYDKIKLRKRSAQTGGDNSSRMNYNNIVSENKLQGFQNPLQNILSSIFSGERKLKPVVKQRETVGYQGLEKVTINMHVIKGENIPIRHAFIEEQQRSMRQGPRMHQQANRSFGNSMQPGQPQSALGGNNRNMGPPQLNQQDEHNLKDLIQEMSGTPKVESYVEVKVVYDNKPTIIKRTTIDEGQQPKWDQLLQFPFEALNNGCFTKEMLSSSDCVMHVSLFDKQIFRHYDEGRIVLQEENRFLGKFEIPIQSLLQNEGKMEFAFKLNRPVILPSYRQMKEDSYFASNDLNNFDDTELRNNEQIPSYINMSVTLDPPISLPTENDEAYYPGYEANNLLGDASEWMIGMRSNPKLKGRKVTCWGENIDGQSVLLCRYLNPSKPPKDVCNLEGPGGDKDYAIEKVARFVSLIPFKEDLKKFADMNDLFCTNQQFLDLGEGDYEEHAILLCNFFNYIDINTGRPEIKSYLLFGEAMPEGQTTYVLRRKDGEGDAEIWSPHTGECYYFKWEKPQSSCMSFGAKPYLSYRVQDPICPVKKIFCIIGSDNIYANVQKSDFPVLMNFLLENPKSWKPLFRSEADRLKYFVAGQIQTYQEPQIDYSLRMEPENCQILSLKFQKHLTSEFAEQRIKEIRKTTRWSPILEDDLSQILIDCEEHRKMARQGGTNSSLRGDRINANDDMRINNVEKLHALAGKLNDLGQKQQNKRFWGFPINMTFTNLDALWEAVKATRMHSVNRKDIEFALTVHIEAYPCHVLSVWIFLAAFVDKTTENLALPQFR